MKNHADATGFKESNAPSLLPVCTSSKLSIEYKLIKKQVLNSSNKHKVGLFVSQLKINLDGLVVYKIPCAS